VRLTTIDTSPVGVPVPVCGETVKVKLAGDPCVIGNAVVEASVVELAVPLDVPAVFQLLIKFVTLTDPRPEARS